MEDAVGRKYRTDYPRASYTSADFYEYYKSSIKSGSIYDVGYRKYKEILNEYLDSVMTKIIEESFEYKMPAGLGRVYVVKTRPKITTEGRSLNIDYQSSRDLKKKIFHLNEHTNGWQYRFLWEKLGFKMHNIQYYELVHPRDAKRNLAREIKVNKRDYIERKWYGR